MAENIKRKFIRRPKISLQVTVLNELCKMPLKMDVIGRFLGLHNKVKEKKVQIDMIAKELSGLWNKLNFPVLSFQRIKSKITQLIDAYVKYRMKNKKIFANNLPSIFDNTKTDGHWLSSEVKKLYELQIESQGTVG